VGAHFCAQFQNQPRWRFRIAAFFFYNAIPAQEVCAPARAPARNHCEIRNEVDNVAK
jgi:hypothetical protein